MNIKLTQRTDYINGMEVTPSALTTVVHLAGGRLVKQVSGTWDPQYYYTDHRGDIRVVYHANATTSTAEVVQEDHLTSLGVQMVGLGRTNWPENQYRYTGKELNTTGFDTNGDNMIDSRLYQYDFGARQYDPLIGRWNSADPANQYFSPYVAMGNDWINYTDKDGKWAFFRWVSSAISGIGWESHQNRGDDQYYSDGWNRFEAAIICGWSEERANAYANGYSRTYGGGSGASGNMGGGGSPGAGGASGGKGSGGFVPSAKHETNPEGEKDKGKSSGDGNTKNPLDLLNNVFNDYDAVKQYIAITVGETANNVIEAAGIGSAILNRLDAVGAELEGDFVDMIGGAGQYDAIGSDAYADIMESSWETIMDPSNIYAARISGAVMPLITGIDYSLGAHSWNATWKRTEADIGFNWRRYIRGIYSITTELGGTTFFKFTDPNRRWRT